MSYPAKQRLRYLFGAAMVLLLITLGLHTLIQASPVSAKASSLTSAVQTYVFPNPATKTQPPVLHIETGLNAAMEAQVFDVAGNLVLKTRIMPHHRVDHSDTASAYELTLNPNLLVSGVYTGFVTGTEGNQNLFREKFRFTLVK